MLEHLGDPDAVLTRPLKALPVMPFAGYLGLISGAPERSRRW